MVVLRDPTPPCDAYPALVSAEYLSRVLAIEVRTDHAHGVALSKIEMLLIEFERTWWADDQPKDAAIADQFSLTTAEYYEQLHALIDSDEALEHDPLVVRRLRRMRDRRRRERFGDIADSAGH